MPSVAPTQASIRLVISSPYRGGTKLWGNRYFFNQTSIPDQTHFNTLADALVAQAKTVFNTSSTITSAIGYNGGSDVPQWTKSYSQAGSITTGTNPNAPLEMCGLVRFSTAVRSTKNHPIYLYKFIHAVQTDGLTAQETLRAAIVSNLDAYAIALIAGLSDGTTTYKLAGPRGAVAQGHITEPYLHGRDFPT